MNTAHEDTVDNNVMSLADRLAHCVLEMQKHPPMKSQGYVIRVVGLMLETVGCAVPVGQHCLVELSDAPPIEAEVVGFSHERTFLMPITPVSGIKPGARVIPIHKTHQVPVGFGLLGRVIDARGLPLDHQGALTVESYRDLYSKPMNPLLRQSIEKPLDVGVRSINALLTLGRGQRVGLFSNSGVGKSILLGMMTRFTEADVVVVGLIGERGREIKEFIENILGEEGIKRAVVVASPADESPLLRVQGALMATTLAEYFRDQGRHVLLLLDSLTRYAQAQREISLSVGEPPVTRGYPASVFAKIPQLLERAGNGSTDQGSITALYTLLTEGDDFQDPISDAARAILDGHIVLSKDLANSGIYPAVDIEASISRVMPNVVSEEHLSEVHQVKKWVSLYNKNKDLIQVGAYQKGTDHAIDQAIIKNTAVEHFLSQPLNKSVNFLESRQALDRLISEG